MNGIAAAAQLHERMPVYRVVILTVLGLPAILLAWGLFGLIMPAVWHPIVTAGGSNLTWERSW